MANCFEALLGKTLQSPYPSHRECLLLSFIPGAIFLESGLQTAVDFLSRVTFEDEVRRYRAQFKSLRDLPLASVWGFFVSLPVCQNHTQSLTFLSWYFFLSTGITECLGGYAATSSTGKALLSLFVFEANEVIGSCHIWSNVFSRSSHKVTDISFHPRLCFRLEPRQLSSASYSRWSKTVLLSFLHFL